MELAGASLSSTFRRTGPNSTVFAAGGKRFLGEGDGQHREEPDGALPFRFLPLPLPSQTKLLTVSPPLLDLFRAPDLPENRFELLEHLGVLGLPLPSAHHFLADVLQTLLSHVILPLPPPFNFCPAGCSISHIFFPLLSSPRRFCNVCALLAGEGSYGSVHKARDLYTEAIVAVKIIPVTVQEEEGFAEIQREVQLLQVRDTPSSHPPSISSPLPLLPPLHPPFNSAG